MWYIITPWRRKCLGKHLPHSVSKHGKKLSVDVYELKYAIVMWRDNDA